MINNRIRRSILIIIIIPVIAACIFAGIRYRDIRQADKERLAVLEVMYDVVPGLGTDSESLSSTAGDLPVMSIQGHDIAGCIEIPSIDLMVPVEAAMGGSGGESETREEPAQGLLQIAAGSPDDQFRLDGDRHTTLRKLSKAAPGETVIFTDMRGGRCRYRVMTQFHLKDWDEAVNDLLICCQAGEDASLVLGCDRSE